MSVNDLLFDVVVVIMQQDLNVASDHIASCLKWKMPRHDFGHFLLSQQHADSTKQLTRYNFLLVEPLSTHKLLNEPTAIHKKQNNSDNNTPKCPISRPH